MNIRIKNNTIKCINFVINLLKYRSIEYVIRNIDINNMYEILFESLYIRKMGSEYKALINNAPNTKIKNFKLLYLYYFFRKSWTIKSRKT